jgi:2-keto-3-deoxy-L-rhamnonate aldolase RhmA
MSSNRFRELIQSGNAAWGVHLSFLCPELVEFCGHLGFEWLFLDAEHQPLPAIMAVPGLDAVGIGPNDLGLSMGIAGGIGDPRVRVVVEQAQARMREHGKPQLTVVTDADQGYKAAAAGVQLIAVSDAALLAGAAGRRGVSRATERGAPPGLRDRG